METFIYLVAFIVNIMAFLMLQKRQQQKGEWSSADSKFVEDLRKTIYSTWDELSLRRLYQQLIRQAPHLESHFVQDFQEQLNFLQAVAYGDYDAMARIARIIELEVNLCLSQDELEKLRAKFSYLIWKQPSLGRLFSRYQKKTAPKKGTKDLFEKCTNVEEVKKRFRRLAHYNHPDKGGNDKAMKEIVRQYKEALKKYS